ncbi:RidA family protein [Mesorhizobium marinum]|uniref:RidA family protein n=1 Tax=Mesorhizobium marinum TaxID=3228790 RepID=A0ABV3QY31_9HYPH
MGIERFGVATKGPGDRAMPFSRAVRAGDYVFAAGQIPIGPDTEVVPGGIVEQSEQTILNLIAALEEAGARIDQVVKCTVWLEDARDFASFNRIFLKYFGAHMPARACVESRLMISGKVEIDAIAYVGP